MKSLRNLILRRTNKAWYSGGKLVETKRQKFKERKEETSAKWKRRGNEVVTKELEEDEPHGNLTTLIPGARRFKTKQTKTRNQYQKKRNIELKLFPLNLH